MAASSFRNAREAKWNGQASSLTHACSAANKNARCPAMNGKIATPIPYRLEFQYTVLQWFASYFSGPRWNEERWPAEARLLLTVFRQLLRRAIRYETASLRDRLFRYFRRMERIRAANVAREVTRFEWLCAAFGIHHHHVPHVWDVVHCAADSLSRAQRECSLLERFKRLHAAGIVSQSERHD